MKFDLPVYVARDLTEKGQFRVRFGEGIQILQFSTTEEEFYLLSVIDVGY
jgi:hypothetical protein